MDAAKRGIREGAVVLPRRIPVLETFAEHLASDAKKLIEDEETGAKSYRYVRTGTNHYSLAFIYDWIASERERRGGGETVVVGLGSTIMSRMLRDMRGEGIEWPPTRDREY